jgi:hypothetical protein
MTDDNPVSRSRAVFTELTPKKVGPQIRALLPEIEAKISEGLSHRQIYDALQKSGFAFSFKTYETYLHRYRKKQRTIKTAPVSYEPLEKTAPYDTKKPPVPYEKKVDIPPAQETPKPEETPPVRKGVTPADLKASRNRERDWSEYEELGKQKD